MRLPSMNLQPRMRARLVHFTRSPQEPASNAVYNRQERSREAYTCRPPYRGSSLDLQECQISSQHLPYFHKNLAEMILASHTALAATCANTVEPVVPGIAFDQFYFARRDKLCLEL